MQTIYYNSKEVIKNRMLKHALTYWGIKNPEDLDPTVKLIMESLSLELYNLGNEIKDTQVRILEKVSNLLAPDSLTSPHPAHAILHASPSEHIEVINRMSSFYTQRKFASKQHEEPDTSLELYFSPVDAVQLMDVRIAHIISGGNLYACNTHFTKQFIGRCQGAITDHHVLWLGLKINNEIESLQDLMFCFDWKSLEAGLAGEHYQLLPLTRWFIGNQQINMRPGIKYIRSEIQHDDPQNIFMDYDLITLKENDIKHYYQPRFLSIDEPCTEALNQAQTNYPACLEKNFSQAELQKLNETLLWIKIEFPAAMPQQYLEDLYVYPNAFPVMNRKLIDLKYRLKGSSNIIPLRTESLDQFLAVKSLADEVREYRSVPFRVKEEEQHGTYTLRNGGVERFDSRNAREMISYLLELLRSESAAFSAYGYDFIATTLKELNQKISLMEQKTQGNSSGSLEIPNYLIVKPFDGNDMMYVQFWTTLAEVGNNLRAGTKMQQARGTRLIQDSICLLTTSVGGKNRLKPEEKLNAFRYGLITRNRIITKEDIRSFCYYELGDKIKSAEVERGFELSNNAREGFKRTIDVILTPSANTRLEEQGWEVLLTQFRSRLQLRSGVTNNYRVVLKNETK